MSRTERHYNGQVVEINDKLGDSFFGPECPKCDQQLPGYWTERARSKLYDWLCLACGNRWDSEDNQ